MENSDVEVEEVAALSFDTTRLLDFVKEGRNRGSELQPSISMVHRTYRDQKPSYFSPQVVSIGPLHRDHENVKEYEGLKGAYMNDLLARLNSPPQQTLEKCLFMVNSSINKIRLCYGGLNNYEDFEVADMMVTDACFILEFLLKYREGNRLFFLGNMFIGNSISLDLLLMENQIPFFVLQGIYELTVMQRYGNFSLIYLVRHFLSRYIMYDSEIIIDNNRTDGWNFKHILEILHKSSRPNDLSPNSGQKDMIHHSVVELDRAGVNFKPNRGRNMAMAMEYESSGWLQIFKCFKKPTFRMPVFYVYGHTELILRNPIAYEQSYPTVNDQYFTSLALTMDSLVDTTEDVAKLVESKVIDTWVGSNETVANMINTICQEVVCINFSYVQQLKDLDDYYKSYWPKNIAWLKRTYFNNPWNAIALADGFLLFVLTSIQTIFSVISA